MAGELSYIGSPLREPKSIPAVIYITAGFVWWFNLNISLVAIGCIKNENSIQR
jgi:hypothetical protein